MNSAMMPEGNAVPIYVAFRIPVTPFFPVLLQFWESDDEFSPKLQLMRSGTQTASYILKPPFSSRETCWNG